MCICICLRVFYAFVKIKQFLMQFVLVANLYADVLLCGYVRMCVCGRSTTAPTALITSFTHSSFYQATCRLVCLLFTDAHTHMPHARLPPLQFNTVIGMLEHKCHSRGEWLTDTQALTMQLQREQWLCETQMWTQIWQLQRPQAYLQVNSGFIWQ